jgi:hypothetical protein
MLSEGFEKDKVPEQQKIERTFSALSALVSKLVDDATESVSQLRSDNQHNVRIPTGLQTHTLLHIIESSGGTPIGHLASELKDSLKNIYQAFKSSEQVRQHSASLVSHDDNPIFTVLRLELASATDDSKKFVIRELLELSSEPNSSNSELLEKTTSFAKLISQITVNYLTADNGAETLRKLEAALADPIHWIGAIAHIADKQMRGTDRDALINLARIEFFRNNNILDNPLIHIRFADICRDKPNLFRKIIGFEPQSIPDEAPPDGPNLTAFDL